MGKAERNSELTKSDSAQQMLSRVCNQLRKKPYLTRFLYATCVLGLLAEPIAHKCFHAYMTHSLTLLLWTGMTVLTVLHELGAPWMAKLAELGRNISELVVKHTESSTNQLNLPVTIIRDNGSSLLRSLQGNQFMMNVITLYFTVLLGSFLEHIALEAFASNGLTWSLLIYFLFSLCFPISSILALKLSHAHNRAKENRPHSSLSPNRLVRHANTFLVTRGAYLGAYAGICSFIALFSFSGVGASIADWLHASMRDANIANAAGPDKFSVLLVSSILFSFLFLTVSPLAVRLSASFQLLANRVIIYGDNLLEALMETAGLKSTLVHLPERNVHVWNIISTLAWLAFCYIALFSLVAFCPPPLGDAIRNWLYASFRDASLDLNPVTQMNVRLFAASIVAGYGAVPVAVMSAVFLPRRKPRTLILSKQGILCPSSLSNLAGFSPLKYWENLKDVSISGKHEDSKVLKLSFGFCDSIKLKIKELDASELAELLSAADEYAPRCKFDSNAVALRLKMIDQTKANSLIESEKFNSTIFSPLNSGDFLNDNKYRIVRKLASKALSTVYLARDNVSFNHVVIKEYVLPTNAPQRERMLLTFEREFKLLSSLNHEGIAQVKEMFEEGSSRYLAIEYIDGHDLRSIIERRGGRDELTVRRWAREICKIMIHLHEQNPIILHRDLTPDNLMEGQDGKIKLIDFGAAHQFMEGVTGTLIGKQCYIAPEQLRGKPSIQSDIYSFACTLFFLITGKDPVALKQSLLDHEFMVSDEIRELIKSCTHFDETQRPDSFKQILDMLENATPSAEPIISAGLIQKPAELALEIEETK